MFCCTSCRMFVGIVPQSCRTIPIDHLSRDDLVTLLYRVAAKLATLPDDPHTPKGTPYPATAGCGWKATEAERGRYWATTTVQKNPLPPYEEEHDPWNAHLRGTTSASSSDVTYRTVLPEAPLLARPSLRPRRPTR